MESSAEREVERERRRKMEEWNRRGLDGRKRMIAWSEAEWAF